MEHRQHSFFQQKDTEGITLIMATDANYNIGLNGKMLFHIPGDLANYKSITMGKNLYCGRKTFDDMGPLKGRHITVLTRKSEVPGADRVINSLDEFRETLLNDPSGYLVGGANLVKKLMPYITRILLTRTTETFEADAGIGNPEDHGFKIVAESEEHFEIGIHYKYIEYRREI